MTPTDTPAWKLLSGSILATHENSVLGLNKEDKKDLFVTPYLAGGNTGE